MIKIIFLAVFVFFIFSPFVRCVIFNLHNVAVYSIKDLLYYIIRRGWAEFSEWGIDLYVGMFGSGKSLSMTHKARQLYDRYGDDLLFISNYKLYDIPYVPLVNFNQLLTLGDPDQKQKYKGYVVFIDEIEAVLSHRNYANFPLQLLSTLCQQRKRKIKIYASSQRFFMVDKLFRSITTHVIDCSKIWRFQGSRYYDAWDYENAQNSQLLKPLYSSWFFVKDSDYRCYSTDQMITESSCADFISNDEKLARIGLDNIVNEKAIKRPKNTIRKRKSKRD